VSLSPAGAASLALSPADADGDGEGEPVQIDGVVPGVELGVSGALHALIAKAGNANRAATATVLNMPRAYPVTATITPGG
jgi:hypothetical protein